MLSKIRRFLKNPILIFYTQSNLPKNIKSGYELSFISTNKRYNAEPHEKDLLKTDQAVVDNIKFLLKNRRYLFTKRGQTELLDVGCGDGKYFSLLKDKSIFPYNISYTGSEVDKVLVNSNKVKHKDGRFILSKVEKISAKDRVFDLVFCSGTLHYSLDNWKQGIRELGRVSKKNVVVTRMPLSKSNQEFYVRQIVVSVYGISTYYFVVPSKKEFEKIAKDAGFKILSSNTSSENYRILGAKGTIRLYQYLLRND